jgi:hypothetical protein
VARPALNDNASRIALARDNLTVKLTELRRREKHVRAALSPVRHLANPWLYVGMAAAAGYRLGRPGPVHAAVAAQPARRETVAHAVIRASMVAIAQALVRRALVRLVDER